MICQALLLGLVAVTSGYAYPYPYPYPHIPAFQEQRQFYYSPASPVQQFPFAAPPATNYVYLAAPQSLHSQQQPPRLVSSVPSALRYQPQTALAASNHGQYVVVYPGSASGLQAVPAGSVVLVNRQGEGEGGEGEGAGWTDFFGQIGEYFSWPFAPTSPESLPVESPDAGAAEAPSKVEKVEAAKKPEMMNEKEISANTVAAAPAQKFVVVGQPQFFGHYAALQKAVNPISLPSASNGAISSFLLLRNGANAQQVADEPVVSADGPGSAALAYHKLLVLSKQQKDRERLAAAEQAANAAAVTIDAKETASNSSANESNEESENIESSEQEEVGPSIAQAKPQAISLAGPGGVAAAAPVGTALVGPGGMALSAPSATAVAGPTQGAPISIAPANKAAKTYFLAKQNPQYLYQFKP